MSKSPLLLLAIALFIGPVLKSSGQDLNNYNFTERDGLPSNNIYYILQARTGHLWFGTDQGVSRYDGRQFTNFNVSNGLLNDDIFILNEDSRGRIWMGSYIAGLCYIEHDSVHYYEFNNKIEEIIQSKTVKQSLYQDSTGQVYLGDGIYNMLSVDPKGDVQILGKEKRNVFKIDGKILTSTLKNSVKDAHFVPTENIIHFYEGSSEAAAFKYSNTKTNINLYASSHYACKYDEDVTLVTHSNSYFVKTQDTILHIPLAYQTDCIYKDKDQRIWLGSRGQGVFVYSDMFLKEQQFHLLDGLTVTHVAEDFQGGIWCSTLDGGVFHFPFVAKVNSLIPSSLKSKVSDMVKGPGNSLFILYSEGDVWHYDGRNFEKIVDFQNETSSEQNILYFDSRTSTLYTKQMRGASKSKDDFKIVSIPLINQSIPKSSSYHYLLDDYGAVYDFRGRGVYQDIEGKRTVQYGQELEYNRIQSVANFKDTVWLGTMKGLYFIKDHTLKKYNSPDLNNNKIIGICGHNQTMAYAVEDLGIVLENEGRSEVIGLDQGFQTLKFTSICFDEEGTLFVSTRDGLYFLKSQENQEKRVKKVSAQQGLTNSKINKILTAGDKLFLGTDMGLSCINKSFLNREIQAPKIYVKIDKINGKVFRSEKNAVLPHYENSIEVEFTSIDYAENRPTTYLWKFGDEKKWHQSENNHVYFDRLTHGRYNIFVKSSVIPGIWSNETSLYFEILPPFWLTWWFIMALSLFFIGALVFLFKWRSLAIKKESAREFQLLKEKADLEMKALRAQMNPHFIFNTLTSIQYLITSNQNDRAEYYLEKFSRLLRMVVDKTEESFATLLEELDMIRIYIDLENLRFNDKVIFNLNLPPNMKIENIRIPGMILQPFVENAIEHGLSKKEEKGHLDITISRQEDLLYISIKDDGIGREKARDILKNHSQHKSVGMSNVFRRIRLMNRENENLDGDIEVLDLKDEHENPIGTQVNIFIKYIQQ